MVPEQIATAAAVSHAKEIYGLAAILLVQIGTWASGRRTGKKRDATLGPELDKRFDPLHAAVTTLSGEVRDLKAYVIGPDGENGLRGDVRELKSDVRGLLDRERDGAIHRPYRP